MHDRVTNSPKGQASLLSLTTAGSLVALLMGPLGLFSHWGLLFCFWYSAVLVRHTGDLQNSINP